MQDMTIPEVHMKLIVLITALSFSISGHSFAEVAPYQGSKAQDVWAAIKRDPYRVLPTDKVKYKDLFDGAVDLIQRSATRTLNDHNDLLPYFTKLAHPNGICLKGEWMITEKTSFSGLFKKDSSAIIIARASVAMNETEAGNLRGFGFAGKLFPTNDETQTVSTANFFLADDLGGTKAQHYTDVEMTNEPKVSKTMAVLANLKYAIKLATTFKKVDENPGMRQVYEIAEANRAPDEKLSTPKWMMVKSASKKFKFDESDFRNELNISVNRADFYFDVYVATKIINGKKNWSKIGQIKFEESIASSTCDHKLHFHHPKWRSDLD